MSVSGTDSLWDSSVSDRAGVELETDCVSVDRGDFTETAATNAQGSLNCVERLELGRSGKTSVNALTPAAPKTCGDRALGYSDYRTREFLPSFTPL